ncbi:MAG: dihydroneopterin aldolase [Chitinophagaceae bacterium]|jgi:7,8-dihydroneopterin aldolase/epimerase/oxygenase
MLSIYLNNVTFFAYHGLYDFEKVNGNHFEVNAEIKYLPTQFVQDIEQTINYANVFELIQQRMQIATPLLETIVMDIAEKILAQFSLAQEVHIHLTKKQPPIPNFNGSVSVGYSLKRNP